MSKTTRRISPPSIPPNTSGNIWEVVLGVLKTIERQHKITLFRLGKFETRLEELEKEGRHE